MESAFYSIRMDRFTKVLGLTELGKATDASSTPTENLTAANGTMTKRVDMAFSTCPKKATSTRENGLMIH